MQKITFIEPIMFDDNFRVASVAFSLLILSYWDANLLTLLLHCGSELFCIISFLNRHFWCHFKSIYCWLFYTIKNHCSIITAQAFSHAFSESISIAFDMHSVCGFNWVSPYITFSIITNFKLILPCISSGMEFWWENYT